MLSRCNLFQSNYTPDRDEQRWCEDPECQDLLAKFGADAHRVVLALEREPVLTDLLAGARTVPVVVPDVLTGILEGRR